MICRLARCHYGGMASQLGKKSITIATQNSRPSILRDILNVLSPANVTKLDSFVTEPLDASSGITFRIDFDNSSQEETEKIIQKLQPLGEIGQNPPVMTHWFPRSVYDLDLVDQTILQDGDFLDDDFVGLEDRDYMEGRKVFAEIAARYQMRDRVVPRVKYTDEEHETWKKVWDILESMHKQHACNEYIQEIIAIKQSGIMTSSYIPQLQDFNEYLMSKTSFRLKPAAGVLGSRNFLNALAFRVFYCKPFIRHHSQPEKYFTCDVVDDLMCSAPLLANSEFADFLQSIGLASLGANEALLDKLSNIYRNTVMYGLIYNDSDKTEKKALGARLLANPNKMKHAMGRDDVLPLYTEFETALAKFRHRPLDSQRYSYFTIHSLKNLQKEMNEFTRVLDRPFSV